MLTENCIKVAPEYSCSVCDYNTSRKSSYTKHLATSKHIKLTESCKKNANEYICLSCDYTTSKKSSYEKHLYTTNHVQLTNVNTNVAKVANDEFTCNHCDKKYMSRVGLWKHKKICQDNQCKNDDDGNEEIENEKDECNMTDKEIIMFLLKENSEFKSMMLKLVENGIHHDNTHYNTNNTANHNNINSNNKAFNLNFFLNETCKNAMNITDFVESLQFQLSDLECIGDLGYVEGISKIILRNLKALDETERPIHCTDKKRETVYVKDENKWEKDENKTRLRKAIKYVANQNTYLIPQWKAKHPDYLDSSSIQSDKYNNIVIEVLGGDDDSITSENKIIRKIAKEFVIDK